MEKTFASYAFGCRVNEAEKILFDKELMEQGLVYSEKNPQVYIINSCAVTNKAEHEVRQYICQIQKKHPHMKIVVTGCAATVWIKNHTTIPGVLLLANNKKNEVIHVFKHLPPNLYAAKQPGTIKQTSSIHQSAYTDKFIDSGRLLIKIQDGCARFCSFCIVPYVRGKPTAIPVRDVVDRIRSYGTSLQEVILTAINTEYVGKTDTLSFARFIETILTNTSVPRVSLGSVHPWSITDEFLAWYKQNTDNTRFAHFFHVPIQSGSDSILKRMQRNYTRDAIMQKLVALSKINPLALIGTDVLVGFPGESEKDFQNTYSFLEHSPICKFHVFRYSPKRGTRAETAMNHIPRVNEKTKKERSMLLIALGQTKFLAFQKRLVGQTGQALSLQTTYESRRKTLFLNQVPVYIKTDASGGHMVHIRITGFQHAHLVGTHIS